MRPRSAPPARAEGKALVPAERVSGHGYKAILATVAMVFGQALPGGTTPITFAPGVRQRAPDASRYTGFVLAGVDDGVGERRAPRGVRLEVLDEAGDDSDGGVFA